MEIPVAEDLYLIPYECLNDESYLSSGDIWQLGILLYQIVFGTFPFTGQS